MRPLLVAAAALAACQARPTNERLAAPPGEASAVEAVRAVYERAMARDLELDAELIWVAGEPYGAVLASWCLTPSSELDGGCTRGITFYGWGRPDTWLVLRPDGPIGYSMLAHELLHVAFLEAYGTVDEEHEHEWWSEDSVLAEAELAAVLAVGEPIPWHLAD